MILPACYTSVTRQNYSCALTECTAFQTVTRDPGILQKHIKSTMNSLSKIICQPPLKFHCSGQTWGRAGCVVGPIISSCREPSWIEFWT